MSHKIKKVHEGYVPEEVKKVEMNNDEKFSAEWKAQMYQLFKKAGVK